MNVERQFSGYRARGLPDGPEEGTISPWTTVASLPFAPETVLPALKHVDDIDCKSIVPSG